MFGVLGADEEVNIDKSTLHRPNIEAHLDVGKDQPDVWQPILGLLLQNAFIRVRDVVIRDGDGSDWWIRSLKFAKVAIPGVGAFELVV